MQISAVFLYYIIQNGFLLILVHEQCMGMKFLVTEGSNPAEINIRLMCVFEEKLSKFISVNVFVKVVSLSRSRMTSIKVNIKWFSN